MGRHDRAKRQALTSKARRDFALSRVELRGPSEEREPPAGATSFPVKKIDMELQKLIDAAIAKRSGA
jgi:hypothetical protein